MIEIIAMNWHNKFNGLFEFIEFNKFKWLSLGSEGKGKIHNMFTYVRARWVDVFYLKYSPVFLCLQCFTIEI